MKITFLGGGNMAAALIGGLVKQGFKATDVQVVELFAEGRAKLESRFGVRAVEVLDEQALACDVLVLAVKPQQLKVAVEPLKGRLSSQVVVSIAAGLRLADIGRWLGGHRKLVREADAIFKALDLNNITAFTSDGSFGLPDQAPFDRIIVTAAAEDPPGPLLAQLRIGGIMVVPVGQSDTVQSLIKVTRLEQGFDYEELRPVRFVPLVEGLGQD